MVGIGMTKRDKVHLYFKLFHSIKSKHESEDFARLELESLYGPVEPITNIIQHSVKEPLKSVLEATFESSTGGKIGLADILTHELPYGRIQGYYGTMEDLNDISKLIRRLGYTREIIVITKTSDPERTLRELYKDGFINSNVQMTSINGYVVYRFITHQFFMEKSEYISKLSRNEEEVENNVETLFNYLTSDLHRIPASETMSVGKRLEDYFSNREESSLYLNHYMHPYKGKFHPKMVRALLNYIYPQDSGLILDNFAGSGTLLVEASNMGLDAYGVEINPLSVLMTNVKCNSFKISVPELKKGISKYLSNVKDGISDYFNVKKGQKLLTAGIDPNIIKTRLEQIPVKIQNGFRNDDGTIEKIIIAQEMIKTISDPLIRDFLLLSLSGSISDADRRSSADFYEILAKRLNDLYLRLFLFRKLNEVLQIKLGKADCIVGDTREMPEKWAGRIDGIVNSPPYSTALDYVKNDAPQLYILHLSDDVEKLDENIIGNPRKTYDAKQIARHLEEKDGEFNKLPEYAQRIVLMMYRGEREDAGLRCFKFFIDMYQAINEMHKVLKPKAKCAIIIGNNHFMVHEQYVEIQNDTILRMISEKQGFKVDKIIRRDLEKSSAGNIRYESVLILQKN